MKEKIERFSKGIFDYELSELVLSHEVLNIFLSAGEEQTASFFISNEEHKTVKGLVYSSSRFLTLEKDSFKGADNEIVYKVSAKRLESGERVEGRIDIVSDCGERQLPFTISVLAATCQSSIGHIKNFFSFQSLAQSNMQEALELFDKDEFYHTVIKHDSALRTVYDALKGCPDRNAALEEFLCSMHKKSECTFFTSISDINLVSGNESFMEKFTITKSSWGYIRLSVRTDASFITPAKTVIENSDFVNGRFDLRLVCDMEHVNAGLHYGNIIITGPRKEIVIPVCINVRSDEENFRNRRLSVKKHIVKLVNLYIDNKFEAITNNTYTVESIKLTEALLMLLDHVIVECRQRPSEYAYYIRLKEEYELYRAYLALLDGKQIRHEEIVQAALLKKPNYERSNHYLYPALLYLEALHSTNQEVAEKNLLIMRSYLEKNPTDTLLFVMTNSLDRRSTEHPELLFKRALETIDKGNRSPLVLLMAALPLSGYPELLSGTDENMSLVLSFMYSHGMISEDLKNIFVNSVSLRSEAENSEFDILAKMYKLFKDGDTLKLIVERLIRNDIRDESTHQYYVDAVERHINTEHIFDYYMYTYGNDYTKPIDQPVLLYYSLEQHLPEDRVEILFAHIVSERETNPAIFEAYRETIEAFTLNNVLRGKINTNLSVIYGNIIRKELIDEHVAEVLPELLFTYRITTESNTFVSVAVTNNKEADEHIYPIRDHSANVHIFSDSCICWLQDREGNRYAVNDEAMCTKYLNLDELIPYCYTYGSTNPMLTLHMWEHNHMYIDSGNELLELLRSVSLLKHLKPEVSNECNYELALHYYDHYESELLDAYLSAIDLNLLEAAKRPHIIEIMIVRDMYERVTKYVSKYGSENLMTKRLSKLCTHGIEAGLGETDKESLVDMCHIAFRNGAGEKELIRFLADNYRGTTLEMYEIWHAAKEANVETLSMEENLLAQMLFAESYVENGYDVFLSYYFKSNINRKLVRAYICYTAYKYFVRGRVTNDEFFEILKAEPSLENSLICILALLKYYSEKEWLTEEEMVFSDTHIRKLQEEKMFFAFFKDFKGKLPLPESNFDKTYVEYRTNPGKQVVIHYSFNNDKDFKAESMIDMGFGLFTKEVVLFHGETLQYFITEISDGEEEITESNAITYLDESELSCDTRFAEINSILCAVELKDDKTTAEYLEKYFLNDYAIKRHFKPL